MRNLTINRYSHLSSTLCSAVTKILSNLRRISLKHQTRLAQFVSQLMTSQLLPYNVLQVLLQVRYHINFFSYFLGGSTTKFLLNSLSLMLLSDNLLYWIILSNCFRFHMHAREIILTNWSVKFLIEIQKYVTPTECVTDVVQLSDTIIFMSLDQFWRERHFLR